MVDYVYRDGSRLTPYMYWQLERLNFDLKRLFGVEVKVTSGIRLYQEQVNIFLSRYVTAGNIRGRRVYDSRVWNGTRYYRISSAGTVAVPRTSNHEIQGNRAAVDLRDTGSDAGITSKNSVRGKWFRTNCRNYDLVMTGDSFGEGWHSDALNIFNAVPGGQPKPKPVPAEPEEEDDDMAQAVGHYIGGDKNTPAEKRVCLIFYPQSGWYTRFSGVNQDYINGQARSHRTENFSTITEAQWLDTVKPNLDKLLAQK